MMLLYSVWTCCKYFAFILLFSARKYDSSEYLNITGITRDQAGDYECSALNDIASPDTKTVKVTVNCKYISFFFFFFFFEHAPFTDTRKGTGAARNDSGVASLPLFFRKKYILWKFEKVKS